MSIIIKTIGGEIKRLRHLSIQTYKVFGFKTLIMESIRYLIHGPLPIAGSPTSNVSNYQKNYTNHEIKELLDGLLARPLFSIVVPVYNVQPEILDKCIKSVIAQYYSNWELCLYDDASTNSETIACLESWNKKDSRIKIGFGKSNKHISLATNEAIKMATGAYIGFLDNDDELSPVALARIAQTINQIGEADMFYSDEDLISPQGIYHNPHFKPDFNLSLLLAHNYITHFVVVKKIVGDKLGWLRQGYEGAQDHDLNLRIAEKTNNIVHISEVLYHWRQSETSTVSNFNNKSYAIEAGQKTLIDYAQRNNIRAMISNGPAMGLFRFQRQIITNEKVSIIIPFKDEVGMLKDCIQSIIDKTLYTNYEILLISNNSSKPQTFAYIKNIENKYENIKVFEYNHPFNFSSINNWAVQQASGKYILLLNNDTKIINEGWLESMLEHIQLDDVGVVGAKLLYPDNTIQHAGVIIGIQGVAGHSHKYANHNEHGYFFRPVLPQELSAVTGACLLTKKELWKKVGGLNHKNLAIAFNDIDYCLKVRQAGYKVVYTPYAKLYHFESKSRGVEDTKEKQERFNQEARYMVENWKTNTKPDPFYNINLSLLSENFQVISK